MKNKINTFINGFLEVFVVLTFLGVTSVILELLGFTWTTQIIAWIFVLLFLYLLVGGTLETLREAFRERQERKHKEAIKEALWEEFLEKERQERMKNWDW